MVEAAIDAIDKNVTAVVKLICVILKTFISFRRHFLICKTKYGRKSALFILMRKHISLTLAFLMIIFFVYNAYFRQIKLSPVSCNVMWTNKVGFHCAEWFWMVGSFLTHGAALLWMSICGNNDGNILATSDETNQHSFVYWPEHRYAI